MIYFEGYHVEFLKIVGYIIFPHIHMLYNLIVKECFPKLWMEFLIELLFLKSSEKNYNYSTYYQNLSRTISLFYRDETRDEIVLLIKNY